MIEAGLAFGFLLVLLLLRVPIAFAMIVVGVGGFALYRGIDAALAVFRQSAFDTVLSYSLSVVPLFILMGNLLSRSGVAAGLFAAANRLVGRMPGGLAMAAIVSCGGFAAVSGSSLATAATMSKVAMPSLRRFGYDDRLATGSIAAGGTLGILIPPSIVLIIYGLLTETDVGHLFVAGVLPGLLGLGLYLLTAWLLVIVKPELAPHRAEPAPMSRQDGVAAGCVLLLFVFILGGIYGGFFTPTEAAGMGVGAALIIALVIQRMPASEVWPALTDSATTTAMIFAVIIGAAVFTNLISYLGLPNDLSRWVRTSELDAWTVIALILLAYLILGCVLESLSMILLTVPVFYPIIYELDFNANALASPEMALVWFGILVVVATEISLITPPVGMNAFILQSVLRDVSLGTIFRGVAPFWLADLIRLALLALFPAISLSLIFR